MGSCCSSGGNETENQNMQNDPSDDIIMDKTSKPMSPCDLEVFRANLRALELTNDAVKV